MYNGTDEVSVLTDFTAIYIAILRQMMCDFVWYDIRYQSLLIQNYPYGMGPAACVSIL